MEKAAPMTLPRDSDPDGLGPSLVRDGPLYSLCARIGMTLDDQRGALRAAIVAVAITWLPLVVLAFFEGLTWHGRTPGPLLTDPAVWARLVVGLPMLLLVGPMIAARTQPAIEGLRGLVPDARKAEFDAMRNGSSRLDHAALPELILIGISVVTGWIGVHATVAATGDWRTLPETGRLSLAGVWAAAISLPVFQFIVLRWLWRIVLWWRFLAGAAGMQLELIPTHPDGFGGLGFLGEAQSACFLLGSPFALIFAAHLAKAVMHGGTPKSYEAPAIAFVILCAILFMGPALSLSSALIEARRRGIFEYGRLGQSYVSQFDHKWVRGGAGDEPLLGTADIQSLADISNSMKVVRELKPIPFERRHFLLFAVCILVPAIPPLLLIMPLKEILGKVAAILVK
jgi:hypothetical protein